MSKALWGAAGLTALLFLAIGGVHLWLALPAPPLGGRESVVGLGDSVVVLWDSLAVPHVAARSGDDLFTAVGYLHARDRMWQMDLLRHAAEGRLSELFGVRTVWTDRSLRVLELPRIARRLVGGSSPAGRRALEAYARGVNAWLARSPRALEFRVLGHVPEPWRPEHSIEIGRLESWDLRTTGGELALAHVARRLGPRTAALLAPAYPDSALTIVPRGMWRAARGTGLARPSLSLGTVPRRAQASAWESRAPASNSWVLGPTRTASRKPILANDPHLTLRAPSIWYLVGAHAPGYEVVGVTIPGIPLVILGHTRALAWGFTNAMVDDVDYFPETLSPDSTRYRTATGWAALEVVPETILVRGGSQVVYRRYRTADGPLVERAADDSGAPSALAMRWVAQDVSDEFTALLGMGRARDLRSFGAAVQGFRSPEQNVVYADTAGNIAYFLAGHVPVRRGAAGRWARYLTAAELPHFVNPPEGFIVTANNRVIGDEYPFFISREWELPYRAERIRELVRRDSAATARSVARQQLDVVDVFARAIAPRAAAAARAAGHPAIAARLSAWDGAMVTDRTEPTIVWSWYKEVERLVYAEVSPDYRPAEPLHRWLAEGKSPWHDLAPLERAAIEHVLPRAGTAWGLAHHTLERHPLGDVPLLQRLVGFSIGPLSNAGDDYTVNVAMSDDSIAPFESTWGPSMRHVVDLGDVDGGGGFILPAGQSGHPSSRHYRDQTDRWLRGELWVLPLDLGKVKVRDRLVLAPERR